MTQDMELFEKISMREKVKKELNDQHGPIRRIINPPAVSTVGWVNNCRIVPLPC
jgi:hypothetical protein